MITCTPIHQGLSNEMLCVMRKRFIQGIARLEALERRNSEQELSLEGHKLILVEIEDEMGRRNMEPK